MMRIGVAMLQGARHEHKEAIEHASRQMNHDVEIVELRKSSELDSTIDGLILPGGESTTMRIASQSESLLEGIFDWMESNPSRPVLGTCAGAILLANPKNNRQKFIDVEVSRNAWGRQRFSFEAQLKIDLEVPTSQHASSYEPSRDSFNHKPLKIEQGAPDEQTSQFTGIFIRAPRFVQETINCEPVAYLENEIVGVLQDNKLALTFHPELTKDRRFHRWLIARIASSKMTY